LRNRVSRPTWPLLVAMALLLGCARSNDDTLLLFAAASLTDAAGELAAAHEATTGTAVRVSTGSSSVLASQIQRGAAVDVFISANPRWMDVVGDAAVARRELVGNRLALVAPAGRPFTFHVAGGASLADAVPGRIAIGDPGHVPAGIYAKAALTSLGWWSDVQRRILPGHDVRAALAYVALGEADAGIVYATDAAASDDVVVVDLFPETSHPPIRYPAACFTEAGRPLFDALRSAAARDIFARHGFTVLE